MARNSNGCQSLKGLNALGACIQCTHKRMATVTTCPCYASSSEVMPDKIKVFIYNTYILVYNYTIYSILYINIYIYSTYGNYSP